MTDNTTQRGALTAGATVYQLNARGFNRWSAHVQPGRDENNKRISDAECEAIARQIAAALASAAPAPTGQIDREALISWVAECWHAEVANRPMINVHRRSLDDTWRQVLRHLGVNDRERLGPTHDELRAEIGSKEWAAMNGTDLNGEPIAASPVAPAGQPSDAQKLLNLADWIEAGCTDHPMHASSVAGWLRALASPAAPAPTGRPAREQIRAAIIEYRLRKGEAMSTDDFVNAVMSTIASPVAPTGQPSDIFNLPKTPYEMGFADGMEKARALESPVAPIEPSEAPTNPDENAVWWRGYRKGFDDAAASVKAEAAPVEGDWVMVPKEPTGAMVIAGLNTDAADKDADEGQMLYWSYTAMLAAAPAPTGQPSVRVGHISVKEGRIASYAFEQFDGLPDGSHAVFASALASPAAPEAVPVEGEWVLTAPDGKKWRGESKMACMRAELDDRVPASVQLERIYAAVDEYCVECAKGNYEQCLHRCNVSATPRAPTVGEQAKRVGAWETPEGYVQFGSWMVVRAFYVHAQEAIAALTPKAPAEPAEMPAVPEEDLDYEKEHPAARKMRLAFEAEYGSSARLMRAANHWFNVRTEFNDAWNRDREVPVTEEHLKTAERLMLLAAQARKDGK